MNICNTQNGFAKPGALRNGFTLLELLVVVTIIALLFFILIPVISKAIYNAQVTQCFSNLRQIGAGVTLYQADHQGKYPCCLYFEFRGGAYGMVQLLENYLPFGTIVQQGTKTEWVDSRYTCPRYKVANRSYNPKDLCYGSYAYHHAFQGKNNGPGTAPEPLPGASTLAGRMTAELRGNPYAGTYSIYHWTPGVYGIIWDNGWTDATPNTKPHNFDGIPGHAPYFLVLFADLHVAKHEWVHRKGQIPVNATMNIPPESRDDQYRIQP